MLKDATARAEPEVRDNFLRAVDVLRTLAAVEVEVAFPEFPYDAAVGVLVSGDAASAFRGLIESGAVRQLRDRSDRVGGFASMMTRAADYVDALRLRMKMRAALDDFLSRYDAVVAPTYPGTAEPIGYDFDQAPDAPPKPPEDAPRPPGVVPAGNLAGLPALCLPTGLGQERPAHLDPVPGPRLLGRRAPGHRGSLPAGHGLASPAPAHRPRLTAMPDPLLQPLEDLLRSGAAAALPEPDEAQIKAAVAVLLVLVVRADAEVRHDEHRALARTLQRVLGLSEGEAQALVRHGEDDRRAGRPLPRRGGRARALPPDVKKKIVHALWRVAFADAELEGREEYLVRKIAEHLALSTADLVETKLRAREEFLKDGLR